MSQALAQKRWFYFAVFTVSGFTGLVYESIWTHYLKLFLGHAAYAQTLVLAIFMAGLAIGSWVVSRYSERISNPLIVYALVEAAIGLMAIGFHLEYSAATVFTFDRLIPITSSPVAIDALKWTIGGLLLLPQAILLGATFPLISGGLLRNSPDRSGELVSMLYFTNSLGAAIGVLVSGFVLIGAVGLPGTVMLAGAVNIVLALVVWLATRTLPSQRPIAATNKDGAQQSQLFIWILTIGAATGVAAFCYEIGWIRMLSLVLGSSTHSFELMLSAFILGLAIGGLVIRRIIENSTRPVRLLAVVMFAMGTFALLTIPLYNSMFTVMAGAMHMFAPSELGYVGITFAGAAIAIIVMLPATICSGMTLPLLTNMLLRSGGGERSIGYFYAANTVGAIVGVLAAVHLLMPYVGVKGLIIAGASVHLIIGLVAFTKSLEQTSRLARFSAPIACGAVIAIAIFSFNINPTRVTSAVYNSGEVALHSRDQVTYLRDGKTATVSLTRENNIVTIATNGKPDAQINMGSGETAPDEITMALAGAIPLLLHKNPSRIANIGIGSGLTSHVVLTSQRVSELTSIEIESRMVEAAELGFMPRVKNTFADPRSHIVVEDAKTFLASSRQLFDIIISEPSNPWVSGVGSLFSVEFYKRIRSQLTDDGIMAQWIQLYETDLTVVASIAKALEPYFNDYAMFMTDDSNLLIIAKANGALPTSIPDQQYDGSLRAELERVGIVRTEQIMAHRLGTKKTLAPLFRSIASPANSDYFPFVDLTSPAMRFMRRNAVDLIGLRLIPVPLQDLLLGEATYASVLARPIPAREVPTSVDLFTRRAESIVAAMSTGSLAELPPKDAQLVMSINVPNKDCSDIGARRSWIENTRELTSQTMQYLHAERRQLLWEHLDASACGKQLRDVEIVLYTFWRAVADRNVAKIGPLGNEILNAKPCLYSDEECAYILTATTAAMIASNENELATTLLRQHMARAMRVNQYQLALRQLSAMSQTRLRSSP